MTDEELKKQLAERIIESDVELAGETVKVANVCDQQIVLHFASGKVAVFGINRGWEAGDEEVQLRSAEDTAKSGAVALVKLGLITQQQCDAYVQNKLTVQQMVNEDHRRRQYEELKKEFEGKP